MNETINEPTTDITTGSTSSGTWMSLGNTLSGGTMYAPSYSTTYYPSIGREVKIVLDLSNVMSDSEYTAKASPLLKTIEDLNWNIKDFKVKK